MAGKVSAFIETQNPSSQPGKPPAENQRRLIAKTSTISMANQKFGIAMPSCVAPITEISATEPRRVAAQMPTGKATKMVSAKA